MSELTVMSRNVTDKISSRTVLLIDVTAWYNGEKWKIGAKLRISITLHTKRVKYMLVL